MSDAVDTAPDPNDASFLADFESSVLGKGESSDEPERPSDSPDPVDTAPAVDPPAPVDVLPSGDPVASTDTPAHTPEPLTYTVNGVTKTLDWILKVGEDGAVIPPQFVSKIQDLVQRDEWQNTQNREMYARLQQYDALTHKVGENEYRGAEAYRQLQAEKAMLDASGGRLLNAINDPGFVINLALAHQSGDPAQVSAVLRDVVDQIKFAGERAQFQTLKDYATQETQSAQSQTLEQQKSSEFQNIIQQFGQAYPALTPDDLTFMRAHFAQFTDRIFRPATMAEAQQFGVRPGEIIKDPTVMYEFVKDRAASRQHSAEAVKAAEKAAAENRVRQPVAVVPKPKAKVPQGKKVAGSTGKEPLFDGDDGSWKALKDRMMQGKSSRDGVSDDA